MDSPESKEFWGDMASEVWNKPDTDFPLIRRLALSIFDHLRATSLTPIEPMKPRGAKPFLNHEMMKKCFELMGVTDLLITPAEEQYINAADMDAFVYDYYLMMGFTPDHVVRENTGSKMSLITREAFKRWLLS